MKTGVVVSDLHCGSIYGLLPPGFKAFDGTARQQNTGQEYLWRCWLDFVDRARAAKPSFVIVNGDCVDGPQRRNEGSELALVSPSDQSQAAIETLVVLRKKTPGAKWFFTQGTPYHVGNWGAAEEEIARGLDAEAYPSVGTGIRCREVLWLEADGVLLEAAHHISVATGFYRLTPLDREAQWSALTGKDASKGIPKADLLIRSHVHFFSYGEHASKQILTTPAWQLQTRYMRKNSVHRMHPDIGGVILELEGSLKKKGEAPVNVRKELYTLPSAPVVKL